MLVIRGRRREERPWPPLPSSLRKDEMPKPKKTTPSVALALVHENYLRARASGLLMPEADFRRRIHSETRPDRGRELARGRHGGLG